ncbi:Rieske (2Fe-2S) protein [Nocardioides sp. zg-1308]|uniref:Cytochrome bc1 complex Rieske iron-sulfur subunit n=1 Tax=Nocardioides renjunii TaxID=3095075 RepID=A0ABU5KF28_9ACTN|nr:MULTISPECIES: Rieske (2Fe-2S) protein [unclassified Nocardioides]MDZ5663567.1 Rieske (2Fe-2S) protein [Nocardioides sp. S-58]NPD07003.1 Rieske (2Fe-2S) protein [Nocardioides sp. zg-1308]WQQ20651.1 Rieske (2Fe-2S) protein [Nocardioides sp. S-34]
MTTINRRRALSGSAAVALGVPVLAACGSDDDTSATDPATSGGDEPTGEPTEEESGGAAGGEALASAADVPVGGCLVVTGAKVVVTQPTEGDFKAFSAVCTHQGCLVETSSEGEIPCPCHASRFSLEDGSPLSGPASAPLEAVEITVDGDSITRA